MRRSSYGLEAPGEGFPAKIAAIDAGSNAIRFVTAHFTGPDSYDVTSKVRVPVRLGHLVFTGGALDPETMEKAAAVFRIFRRGLDGLDTQLYRAVATSATREASNRREFLDLIRRESGISLETIDGREEARLVHVAVRNRIDLSAGRWILVDLGGGSVEVSLVDDTGILWSESYPVGTVRLLETLEALDRCHESVDEWVRRQLAPLTIPHPENYPGPTALAATGGNIEAIARLALSYVHPLEPAVLPLDRLDGVIHLLSRMTVQDRMRELGLRQDRADVILPTALAYRHFALLAHADRIVVPGVGVKDGVLLDLARERTAAGLLSL